MKIKKVTDPEFSRYGRVIDGYDFSKLIKAMEHTPLPEDVIYEPSGVIIGATLMGVINLGMSIMGVDANWQKVVKGIVLLAAVIFDVESKKRAK